MDRKRNWKVTVTRKTVDSKGMATRKDKQTAIVYALESEAVAYGFRQCPHPWPGADGETVTNVWYEPLDG